MFTRKQRAAAGFGEIDTSQNVTTGIDHMSFCFFIRGPSGINWFIQMSSERKMKMAMVFGTKLAFNASNVSFGNGRELTSRGKSTGGKSRKGVLAKENPPTTCSVCKGHEIGQIPGSQG